MQRRATILVGEPAVGKSTIVRRLLDAQGRYFVYASSGLVRYHADLNSTLCVLGDYTDRLQKFPGTDRLSMAVQPEAIAFMTKGEEDYLFEGDRLGNAKMVNALLGAGFDVAIGRITCGETELAERRRERTQPEAFLRRQRTKVQNLCDQFHHLVRSFEHESAMDTKVVVDWIDNSRTRAT